MNQKLEVKLVDMGTNSEEQCNAASFFLVANPDVRVPGLLRSHAPSAHTCRQLTGTAKK